MNHIFLFFDFGERIIYRSQLVDIREVLTSIEGVGFNFSLDNYQIRTYLLKHPPSTVHIAKIKITL